MITQDDKIHYKKIEDKGKGIAFKDTGICTVYLFNKRFDYGRYSNEYSLTGVCLPDTDRSFNREVANVLDIKLLTKPTVPITFDVHYVYDKNSELRDKVSAIDISDPLKAEKLNELQTDPYLVWTGCYTLSDSTKYILNLPEYIDGLVGIALSFNVVSVHLGTVFEEISYSRMYRHNEFKEKVIKAINYEYNLSSYTQSTMTKMYVSIPYIQNDSNDNNHSKIHTLLKDEYLHNKSNLNETIYTWYRLVP